MLFLIGRVSVALASRRATSAATASVKLFVDSLPPRSRVRTPSRNRSRVAVFGYGQEEGLRRSKEAGFDHHLINPVDLEAFISLLSAGKTARGGREASG
jgi:hypothetical protein